MGKLTAVEGLFELNRLFWGGGGRGFGVGCHDDGLQVVLSSFILFFLEEFICVAFNLRKYLQLDIHRSHIYIALLL